MSLLQGIQQQVGQWSLRNFGPQLAKHGSLAGGALLEFAPLLGLCEECGELAEATTAADALDAMGDIGIYLLDYCSRAGVNLAEVVDTTGVDPKWYMGSPRAGDITAAVALLQRAHLKQAQGIRGFEDLAVFVAAQHKAVAILWVALNRCTELVELKDYTNDILVPVARKVLRRDWVEHPNDANETEEVPEVPNPVQ
jgi:hypothetical protein